MSTAQLTPSDPQTFWLINLEQTSHYRQWVFDQIRPHLGLAVLEVGCGNGNFTVMLADHCQHLTAVDLNAEYVTITRSRTHHRDSVEVKQADVTTMWDGRLYDAIVMLDVLEHIEQDVEILQKLRQYLHPRGRLIVKVPAMQSLYSPMDKAIGHYRRYNRQSLAQTLHTAGFQQVNLWYFNLLGVLGWWINGVVLRRTVPPAEQLGFFDAMVPTLRAIESRWRPPFGLGLFAIAVKPS